MTARQALWDVAVDRYGYFTMQDAVDLGLARSTVVKLARRGGIEHVAHGVYRFRELPATEFDPYMAAMLWAGTPDACLSHDTALAGYDVCDINPDRIHLTVPRARRIRRRGGELVAVHYADLAADQVGWWHRIRTVTLLTAIMQCTVSGVPTYLLRQATSTGRARGMLTAAEAAGLVDGLDSRGLIAPGPGGYEARRKRVAR